MLQDQGLLARLKCLPALTGLLAAPTCVLSLAAVFFCFHSSSLHLIALFLHFLVGFGLFWPIRQHPGLSTCLTRSTHRKRSVCGVDGVLGVCLCTCRAHLASLCSLGLVLFKKFVFAHFWEI